MLLFRDEETIAAWCQATHEPYGEVLALQQVWNLSKLWYGNRISEAYRGRSKAEAEAVFAQLGLITDFW
jgi:hypothetical protein